jgi:transposase
MDDGIGLAEVLLGLPGFRVLDVVEGDVEVVISIESTATRALCRSCGVRGEPQDRMPVDIRDLACFGRPARLRWSKRRWRWREPQCAARTWTETSEHVDAQAGADPPCREACRQVGENARPVSQLADELGVCWWTIMNAVIEHGTPLVDDPDRCGSSARRRRDLVPGRQPAPRHHLRDRADRPRAARRDRHGRRQQRR